MSQLYALDASGKPKHPIHIQIYGVEEMQRSIIGCPDWVSALGYLSSEEFVRIRDRIDFLTITNRAS